MYNSFITVFDLITFILFGICYLYQSLYMVVGVFCKSKTFEAKQNHKYGILVSARNESAVIAQLIESVRKQDYPAELLDVFVVADNCTDDTAAVAAAAGATVFIRDDLEHIGKGYALNFAFEALHKEYGDKGYEGWLVLDADNLLDKNYVKEMNKVFDSGYKMVTSYRNSKNYETSWVSSASSLWFLREAKYLNNARMILGTSCAVSGTGFLVHESIIRDGGWKYYLLTEDLEFSVNRILEGHKIGYAHDAVFYDEQPVTFKQAWRQRERWAKGNYQVFIRYCGRLFKSAIKNRNFACYDMAMTVSPALMITAFSVIVNAIFAIVGAINPTAMPGMVEHALITMGKSLLGYYMLLFLFGIVTTITEWKRIHATKAKKILYLFTFPAFHMCYVLVCFEVLFKKVEWKPIHHSVTKTIEDM